MSKNKTIPRKKGIINQYNISPEEVKSYFSHLPKLIEDFPCDVTLTYVFAKVEEAQNRTIYCGLVKLHRTDSTLTDKIIQQQHFTRESFKEIFQKVFNQWIPSKTEALLREAENIRDKVVHGKNIKNESIRDAITKIIQFASEYNEFVYHIAKFKPFGNLKGFKGRAKGLEKSSSRWILKGMGFSIK